MIQEQLIAALQSSQEYFERTTAALTEEHSALIPLEGMFTAAQQVAHVAHTVDWFMEGAFNRENGFDTDFEAMDKEIKAFTSMQSAKAFVKDAYSSARDKIASLSVEKLESALPEGPIMGGLPRKQVVQGIVDHTAHHRGALSVYVRHAGATPAMPYADM